MSLPVNNDDHTDAAFTKFIRNYRLQWGFVGLLVLFGIALIVRTFGSGVAAATDALTQTGRAAADVGAVIQLNAEQLNALYQADPPVINAPEGEVPIGKVELSGTGAPGSDLVLVVDGDPVDKIIVDEAGNWAYVLDIAEPGTHVLTANTLNPAGQVIASSEEYRVNLTTPSNVGPMLNLANAAGLQVGDIELSGSGAPNTNVALVINGAQMGETPVDETGVWRYKLTIGAPGDYELLLNAVDAGGATIASSELYTLAVAAGESPAVEAAPVENGAGSDTSLTPVDTPRYIRPPTNTPYDTPTTLVIATLPPLVTVNLAQFVRPPTDTPRPDDASGFVMGLMTRFVRPPTNTPHNTAALMLNGTPIAPVAGEVAHFVRPPTNTPRNTSTPFIRATAAPLAPVQPTRFVRLPTVTPTNTAVSVAIATSTSTDTAIPRRPIRPHRPRRPIRPPLRIRRRRPPRPTRRRTRPHPPPPIRPRRRPLMW
ncbi:MAG: hypothetical protein R2911_04150 [Caldilineaceae bacterium]